jgi:hypothetical protein
MKMRVKYVKIKGKGWYYVLQVKKWLFWKTIATFSTLENAEDFVNTLKKVDDFNESLNYSGQKVIKLSTRLITE